MKPPYSYLALVIAAIITGATLMLGVNSLLSFNSLFAPQTYLSKDSPVPQQVAEPKMQTGQISNLIPVVEAPMVPAVAVATQTTPVATTVPDTYTDAVNLAFVGDIMLDRGVKASADLRAGGDFNYLFKDLSKIADADILFGNLEGPVSTRGNDTGSKYSFRMLPKAIDVLKKQGFDVLSVANNHMGDWNQDAFNDTIGFLNRAGISGIGGDATREQAIEPKIIEHKGTTFGFLGFTDVGPNWLKASSTRAGVILASDPNFDNIIKNAAAKVDFLVVSLHFGNEYEPMSNARQQDLAKNAIIDGAKIVVGHHPHVPQEIVKYRGGLIAYSLGNFIFDQYFSTPTMNGLVLKVQVKDKKIIGWQKLTANINNFFQVSVR